MRDVKEITVLILCLLILWLGMLSGIIGVRLGSEEHRSYIKETTYAQITKVVEIDTRHDEVVCVDEQGNEWIFTGIEGWQIDDIAIMVMDDKKTDDVEDDAIITVTHESRAH